MSENNIIKVKVATALARHLNNQKEIDCCLHERADIDDMLNALDSRHPGIRSLICVNGREIVDHINVYVNGDNVRYLKGMETPLNNGDVVNIIPAAAAG